MSVISILHKLIENKDKRTKIARLNAVGNFLVKGWSILIGFLSVNLFIKYLGTENYGIWLTLTAFYSWFAFFEFGLGNGLRNKLAEAIAKEDYTVAKYYVSTTYFILFIAVIIFSLIFYWGNKYINWQEFVNTEIVSREMLYKITNIIFLLFFLQFVLKLISSVLLALQKTTLAHTINPLSNLIGYLFILLIYKLDYKSDLVTMSIVFSVVPIAVLLFVSFFFYLKSLKGIAPSYKYINVKKYGRDLVGLGLNFFLIQIAGLIMYQSSNILIAKLLGPKEVVTYNAAFKLLSVLEMGFVIVLGPLWSAFTDAWVVKDIGWITKTIRSNIKIWGMISVLFILIVLFSPQIYKFWLDGKVVIPVSITFTLYIYFVLRTFGSIFVTFLNGISVLKQQLIYSVVGAILFIPISILFISKFNFGVVGLVASMIICNFYGIIIAPIQYYRIINKVKSA